MAQPVVDTLRLSNALQEAGVERAQAEGVARALGDEFGAHVVARGDLDVGFARVEGEFKDVRAQFRDVHAQFKEVGAQFKDVHAQFKEVGAQFKDVHAQFKEVGAEFKAVRAEMAVMRSDLEGRIDALGVRMDSGFEVLHGSMQALDSKFRYMMAGIGLMLAFLSAIAGLAVFQGLPSNAGAAPHAVWQAPAPAGASAPPPPAANVRQAPPG